MNRIHQALLLHLALLLAAALCLSYVVEPDRGVLHMSLAGFFIGTYAMFGKEVAKIAIGSLLARSLPVFDTSKLANILIIVTLVVLAFAGLFAWVVSWEASTGVVFGFAVFLAALLSDVGISPFFSQFIPRRAQELAANLV